MHRLRFALSFGLLLSGCDCGDTTLTIVQPEDGATFNLASDVNESDEGVQILVLVATDGLSIGDPVTVTVNEGDTFTADVAAGGTASVEVTIEEGQNTLVASGDGERSNEVIVTLDPTNAECPDLDFSTPEDGAVLTQGDDGDDEPCGEFHHDVVISTNADPGRPATLYINGSSVADATVEGAQIRFEDVVFASGANELEVRLDGGDCAAAASATVDCGVTCNIIQPTGDTLNQDDDASTDPGMQVDVVVTTDAEEGTQVQLSIDDGADEHEQAVAAGEASFSEIGLAEGDRVLQATCRDSAGNTATSARVRFTVDSIAPEVDITSPAEGHVFGLSEDEDPGTAGLQVEVCATSSERGDLCASVAGSDPGPDGCVDADRNEEVCGIVTCNGNLNLEATLTDVAGNEGSATVSVTCDAGQPVIVIADPDSGAVFSATDDADPGAANFQYPVRVCTDAVGLDVSLFDGGVLRDTVTAVDLPCDDDSLGEPLPGTALFDATLDQGANVLHAEVTSQGGNHGISEDVTVTVDSTAPNLQIQFPLCGGAIAVNSDTDPGTAGIQATITGVVVGLDPGVLIAGTLTNSDGPQQLSDVAAAGGFVSFDATFRQGDNTLSFDLVDAAGNPFSLDCVITGNEGGFLDMVSPTNSQVFTSSGDGDNAVPGYQNAAVQVVSDSPTDGSVCVQVYADDVPVGPCQPYTVAGGISIGVTLPEGAAVGNTVVIRVQTQGHAPPELVSGNVTIQVDTLAPATPAGVLANVTDIRSGLVHLNFAAPADPAGRQVTAYQVRRKTSPFVGEADGTIVSSENPPVPPGAAQDLLLEGIPPGAIYWFAVRAVDAVGNVGGSAYTASTGVNFQVQTIDSPVLQVNQNFGIAVAGGGDVNADGFDDVVIGPQDIAAAAPNRADVFFGGLAGLSPTPDVTITSGAGFSFGFAVAMLDFNGDGNTDVAVGDYYTGAAFDEGAVYIFFGGPGFTTDLTALDADVTITGTPGEYVGAYLANAGDVDGDGLQDLLIAGEVFGPMDGEVYLVRGGASGAVALPGGAALHVSGTIAGGRFGGALGPAGDLNGDNHDDFVIGACRSDQVGAAYVFLGQNAAGLAAQPDRIATAANSTFTSADGTDLGFGCAVGGVADVSGDGAGDVVVGIPNRGPANRGAVDVHPGNGTGGFLAPLRIANDLEIAPNEDSFGVAFATTTALGGAAQASVDAGFSADLVLGQYRFRDGFGRVVYYWGSSVTAGDVMSAPAATDEPVGSSGLLALSYAGDVDGDGYIDLIVGDPNATVGGTAGAGRVYLVH